jgi:hypothetical protein
MCHAASWSRWLPGVLIALILFAFTAPVINAKSQKPTEAAEYKIKAIYIYKFLLFTQWPASNAVDQGTKENDLSVDDKTITIGILGKDPFKESFSEVEGRFIKKINKRLVIKRFGDYSEKIDLNQCHLLFICESEKKNLKVILDRIKGKPILTVGDMENFVETGGMINLVMVANKVRWEINHTQIKECGLRLSSQLLRTALKVK